ncbi:hypothetical protein [Nitrosomonas aestuarii]|uniref:hypothetical protein n=1 Tax=Nitrosomonas aestuarii TaxID=52441 RepID=UPI000D2F5581|nr:hypothetical protein [Nitrosomonas aestuarii]PTN12899.1 hypothetical protein C8R11_102177 [Nitrosomonas aestuarii]
MTTKTLTPITLALMMLFGLVLAMPVAVEAGRGHHQYGHSHHHFYNHGSGHSHHHHHNKRHYKKHYNKKHSKRHDPYYGGYNRNYNQPYYNRPYYNQHNSNPQPRYSYSPNYISSPPVAGYGYPSNMTFGINTGNTSFMLRY